MYQRSPQELKQIEWNTELELARYLDRLLLGLNTIMYRFSPAEEKAIVEKFQNYVAYRLVDLKESSRDDLIQNLDALKNFQNSKLFFLRLESILQRLKPHYPIRYFDVKAHENGKRQGVDVFNTLFA